MPFVVDASVTMAWCFEDETADVSEAALDALLGDYAIAPALWRLEVANVLLVAERSQRVTEAQAGRFVSLLGQLDIRVDDFPQDLTAVLAAGRRHGLSAYDAAYLVLAERSGLPLATLDEGLSTAARNAGVALWVG